MYLFRLSECKKKDRYPYLTPPLWRWGVGAICQMGDIFRAKARIVLFPQLLFLVFLHRKFFGRLLLPGFVVRGGRSGIVVPGRSSDPVVRGATVPHVVVLPVGVSFPIGLSSAFGFAFHSSPFTTLPVVLSVSFPVVGFPLLPFEIGSTLRDGCRGSAFAGDFAPGASIFLL